MTIFGYASSSYIETSYIHGATPGINQYGTKGDWYAIAIINDGQGTNGYTVNNGEHGSTPSIFINSDSHTRYTISNRDGLGRDYAYVIDSYGTTPSDTNPNYNEPQEDFHWISNYGGPYTGWGSTWIIGVTPDKLLHVGELGGCHYFWHGTGGYGGYGGTVWDARGVSTPVMNYHSINIDHCSVANILYNGNAHASQIETSYNHGATPAAHGWMYQGMPAGMSHISIIFDWGGGSYSNQNATHLNGATPGHALRYNGLYPAEGSLSLSDGRGADSGTIYQAYNGATPAVNDPTMLIYGGYKHSYYFYDMRSPGTISADSSVGDRGVYYSVLDCEL